jgi:hypothetical protein
MHYQADDVLACVIIGTASAAVAMSFTQGTMFEPLRKWISAQNKLIGELANCFFCMSHWIVFAGIAVYRPRPLDLWLPADLVVAAFAAIAGAGSFPA